MEAVFSRNCNHECQHLLGGRNDQARVDIQEEQVKNRLRVLRAEREWSQAELAERLQVSRQSVNAIETGKFDPSLPLAFRLARLFETTIEMIFIDESTL